MKKFLRMLFSRITIIGLLLILQIVTTVLLLNYISREHYFAVNLVFFALSIMVLLHLINRDMSPDLKIPWIVFLLILPTYGTLAYIMFSQNKVSFRQRKIFRKIVEKTNDARKSQQIEKVDLSELGEYSGQAKYLINTIGSPIYKYTETKYFACGEDFFDDLISQLQSAKKFIFMEYFIIERGVMWNTIVDILEKKANEGVDVRVTYDDFGCASKIPANYYLTLRKKGIKCYRINKLLPIVSVVHNNRSHRKITVIDGRVAYTGGVNLADEYINKKSKFGYWKDSVLRLSGEGVMEFTLMFLQNFGVQSKKDEDMKQFMVESASSQASGYVIPFETGPRPIYPDYIGEDVVLNLIKSAKKYIYLTTPYLIIDHEIKNALQTAAKSGVDVRIITPGKPDKKIIYSITRYNYQALASEGVKIFEYTPGFMHSKSIIVDGEVGMISTINLDYRSLVHHYECGVLMIKTKAIDELKEDLDVVFDKCKYIQDAEKIIGKTERLFCGLINIFTPLL